MDKWKWHPSRKRRVHIDGERRKERTCSWYNRADNYGIRQLTRGGETRGMNRLTECTMCFRWPSYLGMTLRVDVAG